MAETNENNNSASSVFSTGDNPPATSITAPANGATVSGTVNVNATASDDVAVTSLEIDIDGSSQTAKANSSSLAYSWNTTQTFNGQHTIVSKAGDGAGHTTTSAPVTVTVSNIVTAHGLYVITPCRLIDTRNPVGPFGGPSLPSGLTRNVQAGGQCGVAADATAVAVNIAVVAPAAGGYVTVYPGPINTQRPLASTINYSTGRTLANNAVVRIGPDGTINIFNAGADLNFVVDVTGYFK